MPVRPRRRKLDAVRPGVVLAVHVAQPVADRDLERLADVDGQQAELDARAVHRMIFERPIDELHELGAKRLRLDPRGQLERGPRLRRAHRLDPRLLLIARQTEQLELRRDDELIDRRPLRHERAFERRRALVERDDDGGIARPRRSWCEHQRAGRGRVELELEVRLARPALFRLVDRDHVERQLDVICREVQQLRDRDGIDVLREAHDDRGIGAQHAARIDAVELDRRRGERGRHRVLEHRVRQRAHARWHGDGELRRARQMASARQELDLARVVPPPHTDDRWIQRRREHGRRLDLRDRDHRLGEPHAQLGAEHGLAAVRQDLRRLHRCGRTPALAASGRSATARPVGATNAIGT